ncbi:hypothetical protein [Dryocola clanedunensis]
MTWYLITSGIVLNALLALAAILVIWVWFIWPLVEAISITRCFIRASKSCGGKPTLREMNRTLVKWYLDLLFGRSWTRISNRQFEWEGVGKWRVYRNHDE